jgi:type IV pilus assembly protein PilX
VALIISLILLVVMTLFGLLVVRGVVNEERLTGYVYDRALALQGAEAALRQAEAAVETLKPQPTSGCSDFTSAPTTVRVCAAPAATATPRWLDPSFSGWTTTTAVVSGALTVSPSYFVEYLGGTFPCSQSPDCSSQPCNCLRYRVTARVGEAGRSQVMLQSVYATNP